jgi:hypothetical protein
VTHADPDTITEEGRLLNLMEKAANGLRESTRSQPREGMLGSKQPLALRQFGAGHFRRVTDRLICRGEGELDGKTVSGKPAIFPCDLRPKGSAYAFE